MTLGDQAWKFQYHLSVWFFLYPYSVELFQKSDRIIRQLTLNTSTFVLPSSRYVSCYSSSMVERKSFRTWEAVVYCVDLSLLVIRRIFTVKWSMDVLLRWANHFDEALWGRICVTFPESMFLRFEDELFSCITFSCIKIGFDVNSQNQWDQYLSCNLSTSFSSR